MVRVLTIAILALASMPALAQGEVPKGEAPKGEGDERRYQFTAVDGGALRLDTRSGQVSLCSRRPAGWACALLADDRSALEQEIARLQADNARLRADNARLEQALRHRGVPLPDGAEPPADRGDATPRRDEIDRMMATLERVWRRLVEMIVNLQKDMSKS